MIKAGPLNPAFVPSTFTPLELFGGGEVGVWYDPSDLATLFHLATKI